MIDAMGASSHQEFENIRPKFAPIIVVEFVSGQYVVLQHYRQCSHNGTSVEAAEFEQVHVSGKPRPTRWNEKEEKCE
jgi:hypothetical protein